MKEIILNGEKRFVYTCDRKARCNKSEMCGKECVLTFDKNHRASATQIDIDDIFNNRIKVEGVEL